MAIRININEGNSPFFTENIKDKYQVIYHETTHPDTTVDDVKGLYRYGFKDGTWDPAQVRLTPANDGGYFYLRES